MVTVQGDTPIAIGGARKQGTRKFASQLLLGVYPALGLAQSLDRNRRVELVFQESLMRGRILGLDKGLMDPLEHLGRGREGELVVKQATLDIQVRFHPIQVAFAFGALHGFMIDA